LLSLLILDPIATSSMRDASGIRWLLVLQAAFWSASGIAMFAAMARHAWMNRNAEIVLLGCWVVGTFCFAVFVNWNVAARSILPMTPAAAILAARMWSKRLESEDAQGQPMWRAWLAITPAVALALLVCTADAALARTHLDAATQISQALAGKPDRPDRKIFFGGHWGFQHYMQQHGGTPLDKRKTILAIGDIVILPENNTAAIGLPPGTARRAAALRLNALPLLSTMRRETGAGFYSDVWGPLPFAIGSVPPERYQVMVMTVPLATQP